MSHSIHISLFIAGLISLILIFNKIESVDAKDSLNFNIVPQNFVEAISRINEKSRFHSFNIGGKFLNLTSTYGKSAIDYFKSVANNMQLDLKAIQMQLPNVTLECGLKSAALLNALRNKEPWAFSVIDAYGKPPSGITKGSLLWLGEFSQCLNISVPVHDWYGQYCKLSKSLPSIGLPLNIVYGMCVPSVCSKNDVVNLINFAIEIIPNITNSTIKLEPFSVNDVYCHEKRTLDDTAVAVIIILSVLVFLVIIGTIYDLFKQYFHHISTKALINSFNPQANESIDDKVQLIAKQEAELEPLALRILVTFSAYTNVKKIFNIKNVREGQLDCLNAIRYLSLGWVILGHTLAFGLSMTDNLGLLLSWIKRFSFCLVTSAFFSVDSFFLLSGLLTSYLFLKELSKPNVKLSPGLMVKYYLHRIWRLTPPYMVVIMISSVLSKYIGDGPMYPQNGFENDNCKDNWWANLLYINNLMKPETMCFAVSWYLANDMQFHWIAPIVLIPFALGKVIVGIIFASILLCVHIISTALIINANPGTELGSFGPTPGLFMDKVYFKPWTRVGPFVIGLLVGYLIHLYQKKPLSFKLNKISNLIGWFLSLFLLGLLIFGLYPDNQGNILSKTTHIFYQSFARIAWGVGLGYIIYACVTSNGGIINKILSWPFWIPLSRLTYSAYLIHSVILFYFYSTLEHTFHLQDQTLAYYYVGHLLLSYTGAIFISVFFEIPLIGLEKFIFH